MLTHSSYLPFHGNSQEFSIKHKSHYVMISVVFRILPNINDGAIGRYLFRQKALSCLIGFSIRL